MPMHVFVVHNPPAWGYAQACDNYEVSKKMNIEMEELFAPLVIEKTKNLKDTKQIPHPSHAQFTSF